MMDGPPALERKFLPLQSRGAGVRGQRLHLRRKEIRDQIKFQVGYDWGMFYA